MARRKFTTVLVYLRFLKFF